MRTRTATLRSCLGLLLCLVPGRADAQEPGLKLAIGDAGLGIGDVPRLDGIRLNFRDRHVEKVRGMNLTIWSPHQEADGDVTGLAVGFPLTGAADLRGLAIGAGIAVEREFTGVALAPIGFGAGERIRGIAIGGVGVGGGGDLEGLLIGGVGVGVGGDIRGVAIGGIGTGAGGSLTGVAIGGVGVGGGSRARGILNWRRGGWRRG